VREATVGTHAQSAVRVNWNLIPSPSAAGASTNQSDSLLRKRTHRVRHTWGEATPNRVKRGKGLSLPGGELEEKGERASHRPAP